MLVLATIVIGGLFFNDNAEFFEQANKNYADGMRWYLLRRPEQQVAGRALRVFQRMCQCGH